MQLNNPNRLIQDMCRTQEGISKLNRDVEAVFIDYNLTETEKEALRSGDTFTFVNKAKVHPILAMHYLLATRPEAAENMSIKEYSGITGED